MTADNRWHNFDKLALDLSDIAHNTPNHHTAAVTARALAYLYWQKSVIEELKGLVATLEHLNGVQL
jgi:hypothetical protein